ncbi:HAD family hydrolase [archaeon]|jgi:HAD superfamily hydrolase (TIGR01549 family)|nr:HAD family hydrolase [archaeon]
MIICFDLDGTLVDTEKWIVSALKESFKLNKKKVPTKKQIFKEWGKSARVLIKAIDPALKKEEIESIRKDFYEVRKQTKSMITPFPNTKQTLRKLSKNYKLAILSNNSHKIILEILNITKIDKKLFSIVVGDDEVKRAKPFPDEIYKAENKFKKKVNFMIGDTVQDIKTAKAANVKSIIIKQGPKETWKNLNKANFIIRNISELPELIKEAQ